MSAYLVSEATGWDLVPPTVLRDGPFGPGMCQLWVDVDEASTWPRSPAATTPTCAGWPSSTRWSTTPTARAATCCRAHDGRVHGVDHGICFSAEDKLRTLLWQWRGEPLTDEAVEVLSRLRAELEGALGEALRASC